MGSHPAIGCCKFSKGMLSHILGNRIYLGMIVHKGDAYPGEHAPIVTQDLWDAVQTARAERASGPSTRIGTSSPSLLRGRLLDGESRAMKPSHATKPNRRYRYYVTRPDLIDISPAWRVPAHDLETMVFNEVAKLLTDRHRVHDLLGDAADAAGLSKVIGRADTLADTLRSGSAGKRLTALHAIVHQVQLHEDAVIITIEPTKLLEALGVENTDGSRTETIILSCNAVRIRRGQEVRLVIPPNNDNLGPVYRDEKLVALVAKARATVELIIASPESSIGAIAVKHGRCRVRFAKLAELSCLAPDIVVAIVEGRQPISLTPRRLLATHLPLDWQGQRAALGFRQTQTPN